MAEQISLFARQKKDKKVKFGVAWLKILVRFVLWIYAGYNLIIGAKFITDAVYNDKTDKFYKFNELSEIAQNNFEYGIVCCLLFILLIIAIYAIATFKKYADGYSIICFIFGAISSVSYYIVYIKALKLPLFANGTINSAVINLVTGNPLALINLVVGLVMIAINSVYFIRRKHYFR